MGSIYASPIFKFKLSIEILPGVEIFGVADKNIDIRIISSLTWSGFYYKPFILSIILFLYCYIITI